MIRCPGPTSVDTIYRCGIGKVITLSLVAEGAWVNDIWSLVMEVILQSIVVHLLRAACCNEKEEQQHPGQLFYHVLHICFKVISFL